MTCELWQIERLGGISFQVGRPDSSDPLLPVPSLPGAQVLWTGNEVKLNPPASLSAAEHWLQVLAGSELNGGM